MSLRVEQDVAAAHIQRPGVDIQSCVLRTPPLKGE